MFGAAVTHHIVAQTMRCLAIQYTHELTSDLGVKRSEGVAAVALFFSRLLKACGQDFDSQQPSECKYRIVLRSFKPSTQTWTMVCARPGLLLRR